MSTKVAIVTGSSRGIGREIALTLAKAGHDVVVNYTSNQNSAQEVVEEIQKLGRQSIAVRADVSKSEDIKSLFKKTIDTFGGYDILVNNAGIILYKLHAEVTDEEFDQIMGVNVRGTFLAMREAAQTMRPNGRIINFSSSTTNMMLPTYGAYVATKGAVEQLTRSLSKEVGSKGITVNVVSPGPTETDLFLEGKSQEQLSRFEQMSAFNRLGKPRDIAEVVNFLASDAAAWITGQNIRVNGGTI
jgi:3-oxoacyl-[acyl-carrier protein] reductase